jgi:hypothetical protein
MKNGDSWNISAIYDALITLIILEYDEAARKVNCR